MPRNLGGCHPLSRGIGSASPLPKRLHAAFARDFRAPVGSKLAPAGQPGGGPIESCPDSNPGGIRQPTSRGAPTDRRSSGGAGFGKRQWNMAEWGANSRGESPAKWRSAPVRPRRGALSVQLPSRRPSPPAPDDCRSVAGGVVVRGRGVEGVGYQVRRASASVAPRGSRFGRETPADRWRIREPSVGGCPPGVGARGAGGGRNSFASRAPAVPGRGVRRFDVHAHPACRAGSGSSSRRRGTAAPDRRHRATLPVRGELATCWQPRSGGGIV